MPRRPFTPFTIVAGTVLGGLALFTTFCTSQPPGGGPPPLKNLKVYPKDIPRQELIADMREFSFALGVGCEHCHVDEEGPGGKQDFASDEKPAKEKARAMLRMTDAINGEMLPKIPNRHADVTVKCVTCHHGLPIPQTLGEHFTAAIAAGGGDSAVAELKHLHDNSVEGLFDISEWGVNEAARKVSQGGKHAEALKLLEANQTYYPKSESIPGMMAEIHLAKGDTAIAIDMYKKIVAANPDNRRAKMMLDRLTGKAPK